MKRLFKAINWDFVINEAIPVLTAIFIIVYGIVVAVNYIGEK